MTDNVTPKLPRRTFLQQTGAAAIGGAALFGGRRWLAPAQAATMPSIPKKTVTLACNPYTNHAWVVLAGRMGYFEDVGITLEPPDPKVVLIQQSVPQLENREIDMSTMYVGMITSAIDKLPHIKPCFVYSYWAGNTILTAPDSRFKTVDDFIADGLSWDEAAKQAMAQLEGEQVVVPPNPSTYPWMNLAYSYAGLTMEDSAIVALEDPKAVQLAIAGRVPFAAPGGAVQIYQLQHQAGWRPVMSTGQMLRYEEARPGSPINNVLNYDLVITTQRYIDENRETMLRVCSALYRTLDYIFGPNQVEALSTYAPFINAHAGSDLDAEAIKFIFEVLDPFFLWEDQERLWTDETYPLYYKNIYEHQLQQYIEAGTIEDRDYDLDDFFQGKDLWQEMKGQKERADALIAKLEGESIGPERQAIIAEAKRHYANYNFLDAVRFLEAAMA